MSKKKILLVAGAVLLVGGIGTVIAQQGPGRGWGMHRGMGHGMGPGMEFGFGGGKGPGGRMGGFMKQLDKNGDGIIDQDEALTPSNTRFDRVDANKDSTIEPKEVEAMVKEGADFWAKRLVRGLDQNKDGKIALDEFQRGPRERFRQRDMNDDGKLDDNDMPPGMRGRRGHGGFGMGPGPDGKGPGPEGKGPGPDGKGPPGSGMGPGMGPGMGGMGPGKGPGGPGMGPGGGMGPFTLEGMLGRSTEEFKRLDKNGDGVIDQAEIDAIVKERVDYAVQRFMHRFDQNKDGKVTRDEFNRFAKERFAQADLNGDGKINEDDLPPMMRGRGFLKK